ncbi:FAD/FMN-containing dehydrogenase [Pseudomonas kuykendallii]|uniref:FAD/FMN-containing dehydrogenase n=1 Tax=Pseudomonas kuykendallii TaxID=1007099 RepID=A0A1H2WNS5_9PSED|nr:FAD/FMN-containing dehydrogenase [Pseudomonas kuykendallii]MCQ4270708.1 FAD/FMN-containing dehydrogenase [Pseudomonas kuykendallii]SDW82282.1 hypothetical protein SAMN05216287_1614 [Pseudomonas kuykendallii]
MKVWILLCAALFPALLQAAEETQPLAPWTLLDQYEQPYTLSDDLRVLLVARDMAGAKLVEMALADKPKGYLEQRRAVFLADISRMPSLVAKLFAVPAMRDYPYRVVLDREARIVPRYEPAADAVLWLQLDGRRVLSRQSFTDAGQLSAALQRLTP